MITLKGWKYGVFIGSIVGIIGVALYPIVVQPIVNPEYYKKLQQQTRKGVKQEEIQPGNMKVWSDPFERKN